MKFAYLKFPLPKASLLFGDAILRPIVPISISYGGKTLRYAALIDSGADFCIFDAQIGDYLGIDIAAGTREKFGGVQEKGGAEAFLHHVSLSIGGATYETTVGFSRDIAPYGFGLLGQKGFFENFSVKFDLHREEIEIQTRR